jgi:hypothetical protein
LRYDVALCFGASFRLYVAVAEEEAPGVMSGQSEVAAALALSSALEVKVRLGLACEVTSVDA